MVARVDEAREQCHRVHPQRLRDLTEFDDIDAALALLDQRNDGLWAADPLCQLGLRTARRRPCCREQPGQSASIL